MDLVANFTLNNDSLDAQFDVSEVQNFDALFEINASGTTWGSIEGSISNQTDLKNALDTLSGQVDSNHNEITTISATLQTYGDIVTHNVDEFATATQGTLADTAIQPGNNISQLNNNVGYITSANIGNGVLTIKRNNATIGTFTANQTSATNINISVPTTATEVGALPSDTIIGDGKAIFKKNGTAFATITANQTNTININYSIPTQASDIGALPDTTTIGAANTTIKRNNVAIGTINANATQASIINIAVPTTATEVGALPSDTTIEDLTNASQQAAINSGITSASVSAIASNTSSIDTIESLIPTATTPTNQLADKNFVNSSISTNTANFIGTFNSVADLEAYSGTLTNNDYAFVETVDAVGNTLYDRYKYTTATTPPSWQFEYELNNSSFTSDQWAAINSGITAPSVSAIAANTSAIANKQDTLIPGANIQISGNTISAASTSYIAGSGIDITSGTISANSTIARTTAIPTATSDLYNDSGYITGINSSDVTTALGYTPVNPSSLATVATTGTYSDLIGTPTIPTVNDATLTITQGGTTKGTFTANASNDVTIDVDEGGSTRNIGEIVVSTIPLTDADLHLSDGALLQYGSYQAFIDCIADLYTDNPNASYFAPNEAIFTQPILSANGTLGGDSFAVSASDEYSTSYQAWQAFDNDVSTNWLTSSPANVSFPVNLIIYNPTALKCSSISITTRSGYASTFTAGVVYGSNDNSTWTILNSFTNSSTDINSQYTIDLSSNTNFYKYYKIEFTEGRNDSGTANASYGLAEVKLNATYQISPEQWWQDQVTTYGVCDKFVYDSVNNTVRLPKYGNQIFTKSPIIANTVPVKGNGMNIGYTNGTENFGIHVYNHIAYADTPAYGKPVGTANASTYPSNKTYGVTTDGSKSGIIADTSSVLTNYPLDCYYYIVIATSTKTDIQVDIDEIATDLNGKMDTDGTNAVSSVKFADGQWVVSDLTLASGVTWDDSSTDVTYSLSSYLPNDNYNYEVIISVQIVTASTSGKFVIAALKTDLMTSGRVLVCEAVARSAASRMAMGNAILPVGSGRNVTYLAPTETGASGAYVLRLSGYRRIGTNQ